MNTATSSLLSNLITNKLIAYGKLVNPNDFAIVSSLISSFLVMFNYELLITGLQYLSTMSSWYTCAIVCGAYYAYSVYSRYSYYQIESGIGFLYVMKWLKINEEHTNGTYNTFSYYIGLWEFYGNYHYRVNLLGPESSVYFTLPDGTKGYIKTIVTVIEKKLTYETVKETVYHLRIYMKNISPEDFYTLRLVKSVDEDYEQNKNLSLYSLKSFYRREDKSVTFSNDPIYQGGAHNREDLYVKYIKSYFSDKTEYVWNYVKQVHDHPEEFTKLGQSPRVNMIFYGPPGTGKSSLAYRLAMATNRNIVLIDICNFINKKQELFDTFHKPMGKKPCESIILLEEFDIAVSFLLQKEGEKSVPYVCKDEKEETKKDFTLDVADKKLQIADLLELLQGPVPIDGSIVLATTNKLAEMKAICPALFRAGRLTPIEIGNISWFHLQEMTQYYFGKSLQLEPVNISIPTSEIIELANACKLFEEGGFDTFSVKLAELLHTKAS
jgi:hypothetical protein